MKDQYPNQRIIEREFDVLNRINKIKQDGTQIANMEFIGRTYRMLSKGYQNGDVVKYLYDQGRRMTGSDAKNLNQQIINQYAYGYNKVNLKNYEQRLHDANKGDVYAYDAINRIKNIKFDAADPTDPQTAQFAKAKTYNLDKVDNILKIVENKNSVDTEIVTEMTGSNAQLNQYGKFDQWNMAYDQNGNTTQKGTQQFSYNFRNQLVRASDGSSTVTMKYDPLGRRIEKAGSSGTIRFYYAGNQVIEERNGSDDVTKQYVYGNGIDELLRLDVYSGATSTPYYIHSNDIGSTTAITDSTGVLVERIGYDTFGLPSFTNASGQSIASSSIGNTTLFQGREYDPELNLYNYRARYYDPIMGRFLQTDPVGYKDSMNLYQSFGNNPVNFTDPMGERLIFDKRNFKNKKDFTKFKSDVIKMIKYLYLGSAKARGYLERMISTTNYDVYLIPGNIFQFYPNFSAYNDDNKESGGNVFNYYSKIKDWHGITLDPYSGLREIEKIYPWYTSIPEVFDADTVQSPALGLIHELIHSFLDMKDKKTADLLQSILAKHYVNYLEKKVIEEESRIAIELGEPSRFNHGGTNYPVDDPTSHCHSLEADIWDKANLNDIEQNDLIKKLNELIKLIETIGD